MILIYKETLLVSQINKFFTTSILRWATILFKVFCHSFWHTFSDLIQIYGVMIAIFFEKKLWQLCQWRILSSICLNFLSRYNSPNILNYLLVWCVYWPFQNSISPFFKPCFCLNGNVKRYHILIEDEIDQP